MRFKIIVYSCLAVGGMALSSLPGFSQPESTPAERAQTAKLNQGVADANAEADRHYSDLEKQYQDRKTENQELQQKYQEEKKQNDLLQQQYQEKLKAYQEATQQKAKQ